MQTPHSHMAHSASPLSIGVDVMLALRDDNISTVGSPVYQPCCCVHCFTTQQVSINLTLADVFDGPDPHITDKEGRIEGMVRFSKASRLKSGWFGSRVCAFMTCTVSNYVALQRTC
jgi:hypothetical protein